MIGTGKLRIDVPRTLYSGEMMNGSCVVRVENNRLPIITRVRVWPAMCMVRQTFKAIQVAPSYYQSNFTISCINGNHYIRCFTYRVGLQVQLMITGMCS